MTPADYIRWYHGAAERAAAPSLDPVKAEGIVYARICRAKLRGPALSRKSILAGRKRSTTICPGRFRHWSYAERQWVCGRCGSPWRFWLRHSLRGEVQEGRRRDGSELRLQRMVDVGLAIRRFLEDPRWRWEARLYALSALGHSAAKLAEAGARGDLGDGASFTWARTTVQARIQAGGREWRRILGAAGFPFEEPGASA